MNDYSSSIKKIRKLIKSKSKPENWEFHIFSVVRYSKLLAQKLGSDKKMAELGALLHDVGWIVDINNDKDHEINGQPIAEKILKRYHYSQKIIDEIKHIIASHRGSVGIKPKTTTAKIVANADAMAHFDVVPWLIQIGLKNNRGNLKKSVKWVCDKIERDWKKLTLLEAKKIVKKKYEAIKIVLEPITRQK